MTEIEIVQTVQENINQNEQELTMMKWQKLLNLNLKELKSLAYVSKIGEAKSLKFNIPEMLLLKLKKLFKFSEIIPIINGDSYSVKMFFDSPRLAVYSKDADIIYKNKSPLTLPKTSNYYSSNVLNKKLIKIYNTEESISGFLIINHNSTHENKIKQDIGYFPDNLKSGNYSEDYIQTEVLIPAFKLSGKDYEVQKVIFQSESQTNEITAEWLQTLMFLRKFSKEVAAALQANTIINYFLTGGSLKTPSNFFKKFQSLLTDASSIIQPEPLQLQPAFPVNIQNTLAIIQEIYPGKFNMFSREAVARDLISLKLEYFLTLILLNKDISKPLKTTKEIRSEYIQQKKESEKKKTELFNKFFHEQKIRWYFINKFGLIEFNKILKKIPVGMKTTASILDYIPAEKAKQIKIYYEKNEEFLKTVKQEHAWSSLARKLKTLDSEEEIKKVYSELKNFIPEKQLNPVSIKTESTASDWIRTNSGIPVICPHVRDKIELEMKYEKTNDIRDYLVSSFAGSAPFSNGYYCKICGELLAETREMEGITISLAIEGYSNAENELKELIWKQARYVIIGYIEFKTLKTSRQFSSFLTNVTNKIYDFISVLEKKLLKMKSITQEETEARLRFFTNIYIFALLLKVVKENPDKIKFKFMKNYENKLSEKSVADLLNKISSLIFKMQNISINIIFQLSKEAISVKYIHSALLKTYNNIQALLSVKINESAENKDIIHYVLQDPMYSLLIKNNLAANFIKNPPKSVEFAEKTVLNSILPKAVLGITQEEMIESGVTFIHARNYLKPLVPVFSIDSVKKMLKDFLLPSEILSQTSNSIKSLIVDYLLEYSKGIYENPVWFVEITENKNNPAVYDFNVKQSQIYTDFYKKYEKIKIAETLINSVYKFFRKPAYARFFNLKDSKKSESDESIYLSVLYGPSEKSPTPKTPKTPKEKGKKEVEFHKHVWNLIVYKNTLSGDFEVYSKQETSSREFLNKKEYEFLIQTDRLCEKCKNKLSEITEKYPDIDKSVSQHNIKVNFYNYFSKKCPNPPKARVIKGDLLHDYIDSVCKNCGISQSKIQNLNSEYFKKYISVFNQKEEAVKSRAVSITAPDFIKSAKPVFSDFKFSENLVREFVNKFFDILRGGSQLEKSSFKALKLSKSELFNLLFNLGLAEEYYFEELTDDALKPASTVLQKNSIHSYIQQIIYDFSAILYHENISKLDFNLKIIVNNLQSGDADKLKKINLSDIYSKVSENLKLENNDYYFLSKRTESELNPAQIGKFSLSYLINLIMVIYNKLSGIKISNPVVREIILMFVNFLISSEKKFSKIKEEKSVKIQTVDINPNLVDNRFENFSEEENEEEVFNSVFSYEGFDYEEVED